APSDSTGSVRCQDSTSMDSTYPLIPLTPTPLPDEEAVAGAGEASAIAKRHGQAPAGHSRQAVGRPGLRLRKVRSQRGNPAPTTASIHQAADRLAKRSASLRTAPVCGSRHSTKP